MNKTRIALVAIVTGIALVVVSAASATYSSAKLAVTYGPGNTTRIIASSAAGDDATARATIIVSKGTAVSASAAPGTTVGTVKAQVAALALGGALLPLSGDIIVAAPGQVPAASQTACIGAATPTTTYVFVLAAAGQTINLPAYLLPADATTSAFGDAQLVFCLAPPDIPVDKGGATFGAKFLSADMTFNGVFGALPTALWMGFWTPWTPAIGQVNQSATVASPSTYSTSAVSLKGKRVKGRVTLTGKVLVDGDGIDIGVRIWGAGPKGALKPMKSVLPKENGTFSVSFPPAAKQTRFQARFGATALTLGSSDAASFCTDVFSSLPVPCSSVSIAISGSQSKVVTVK
ncbi:MAG: hypothetical protein U0R50_08425 [Gaiellales bacterium]